jgi:hypothetical protein
MNVTDHSFKFKVYIFCDMDETSYKLFLEQIMRKFTPHDFLIMELYYLRIRRFV